MLIGIIAWIVIGLVTGQIASRFTKLNGDDPLLGIGVAVGGAVAAGWIFHAISGSPVSALNVWGLFVVAVGSSIAAAAWYVVRSRATPVEYHNRRYH